MQTPCIQFLGKSDLVSDLRGEKLNALFVAGVLASLTKIFNLVPSFLMLAPDGDGYTLFIETGHTLPPTLVCELDQSLSRNPHYAYCRRLGQLAPARIFHIQANATATYLETCRQRGQAPRGHQTNGTPSLNRLEFQIHRQLSGEKCDDNRFRFGSKSKHERHSPIILPMFGSHLSISGGMHLALLAAEGYGMETVQVFTKNQQQWSAKPLDETVIRDFRSHAERLAYQHIVAHDSYLINLAAPVEALWEKSIEAFADEMRRCDQLGIPYLVTHPGAHVGSGEEVGIARVIAGLTRILPQQEGGKVTVCLETTAGQGSTLGRKFEEIAAMLAGVEKAGFAHRVSVCVDTCHILAAGYDITTANGTRAVLGEMDRIIGLSRVKVWHLNDSKKALGTRVDRHEHIGRGFVGMEAFGVICSDPCMAGVPKIMETPKEQCPDGRDWDVVNLELLRGLGAGKKMTLKQFEERAKTTASAPEKKASPSRGKKSPKVR